MTRLFDHDAFILVLLIIRTQALCHRSKKLLSFLWVVFAIPLGVAAVSYPGNRCRLSFGGSSYLILEAQWVFFNGKKSNSNISHGCHTVVSQAA